jgi:hypothetical protein
MYFTSNFCRSSTAAYRKFHNLFKLNKSSLNYSIMSQTSNKHKIAILQFTAKADKQENFEIAKNLIEQATKEGAEVEYFYILIV